MITRTVTYSEARNTLADCLREVVDDMVPIVIKQRGKKKNAVLVSEDEYNSLIETAYISSGKNGERLRESMAQAKAGKTRRITLDEIDKLCK